MSKLVKRNFFMDAWILAIDMSYFMVKCPGMNEGPSGVRACFRAVYSGYATDEQFMLTELIHKKYNQWCKRSGGQTLTYPRTARRLCNAIAAANRRKEKKNGHV